MRRWIVGAICILAVIAAAARAAESDAERRVMVDAAHDAFRAALAIEDEDPLGARQRFADAAAHYAQLRAHGVDSAALHYNLGNAQFKAGDLGAAIASYRRAVRRAPGHSNARENLAYARSLVPQQLEGTGTAALRAALLEWPQRYAVGERALVTTILWSALWLLIALRLGGRARGAWWWWTTVATVLAGSAAAAATISGLTWERTHPAGVITATEIVARQGDGTGFEPAFLEPLAGGVEFIVIEDRGAWKSVELRDGSRAWVPESALELIHAPSDGATSR